MQNKEWNGDIEKKRVMQKEKAEKASKQLLGPQAFHICCEAIKHSTK